MCYNRDVNLSLFHDSPSSMHFAAWFAEDRLLSKLHAIDAKARRRGLIPWMRPQSADPHRHGAHAGRQGHKNSYGLFHLSWLAEQHPEWPRSSPPNSMSSAPVSRLPTRKAEVPDLAGMGGSAEDKSMFRRQACWPKGRAAMCSTAPIPAAQGDSRRHRRPLRRFAEGRAGSHANRGTGARHDLLRAVVNLESSRGSTRISASTRAPTSST